MNASKIAKNLTGLGSVMAKNVRNASNEASKEVYNYKTLAVSSPHEFVYHVELNRPDKRNAMNPTFFKELTKCFEQLQYDKDCRAIMLSGRGKGFCSGIDLAELAQIASIDLEDAGRRAFFIRKMVAEYQNSMSSVENVRIRNENLILYLVKTYKMIDYKCHKPVIALVHGHCVGGAVDLITACDIRYSSKDAWYSVKEVDMGLAADIGTLQRFPKIVGNDSLVRELIYTARKFTSDEAQKIGLVSKVVDDQANLIKEGLELAKVIAAKSPVAVQGSKINLVYSRDRPVQEGLNFMTSWSASMLQSEDVMKSAMAAMSKEQATFSKL